MQLLKDRVGAGSPLKWLEVCVVVHDELVDALDESLDAGERSAAACLVGDPREEAFERIDSGTVGRDGLNTISTTTSARTAFTRGRNLTAC